MKVANLSVQANYLAIEHCARLALHSNGRALFSAGKDLNSFLLRETSLQPPCSIEVSKTAESVPFNLKPPIRVIERFGLAA